MKLGLIYVAVALISISIIILIYVGIIHLVVESIDSLKGIGIKNILSDYWKGTNK